MKTVGTVLAATLAGTLAACAASSEADSFATVDAQRRASLVQRYDEAGSGGLQGIANAVQHCYVQSSGPAGSRERLRDCMALDAAGARTAASAGVATGYFDPRAERHRWMEYGSTAGFFDMQALLTYLTDASAAITTPPPGRT